MITFNFNDGGRKEAGYKGDAGDCVCRSIAIASGLPYQQIYNALANGNKNQRLSKAQSVKIKNAGNHGGKYLKSKMKIKSAANGIFTKRKWFNDYMTSLGFKWVPTMFIGQGCKVHLRENELPKGRLVVNVSGHFTSVIDGVLNDTYDCSRGCNRCVYGYYILNINL